MNEEYITAQYDESLAYWQANGWACKNCGDLEMLSADDEDTIINGPFVNGICKHCNDDGFDTPEHEGHEIVVRYPATQIIYTKVIDQNTLHYSGFRYETEPDSEPVLYCVTCGDVEVLPAEVGLIPDEWQLTSKKEN